MEKHVDSVTVKRSQKQVVVLFEVRANVGLNDSSNAVRERLEETVKGALGLPEDKGAIETWEADNGMPYNPA